MGDTVEMVVKTYLGGGYAGDDAAAFDGALRQLPAAPRVVAAGGLRRVK